MYPAALLAVSIVACATVASAQQSVEHQIERDPLLIFVAEGPPNSCGPGCNRWIAVEGKFDRNSPQRVRDFLTRETNREMPIYFHSEGGWTDDAIKIGRLLRELRMTAGIGRTVLQRCAGAASSQDCRRLLETGRDRSAHLRLDEGQCNSACFLAFIGASHRTIDPRARVRVHASGPAYLRDGSGLKAAVDPAAWQARRQRVNSQYVAQMGIDPGVVELSLKTPHSSLRVLTRAELERLGVISKDHYETPWIRRDEAPHAAYTLLKILTGRSPGDDKVNLTATLGMTCYQRDRVTVFIERELAAGENGHEPHIHVLTDEKAAWVSTNNNNKNSLIDYREQVISFEEVLSVAPKRSLALTFNYASSEWKSKSTTIKLSIKDLEPALMNMRRECERIHGR